MEKLIKLLNEFEKQIEKKDGFPIYNWYIDKFYGLMIAEDNQTGKKYKLGEAENILISKRYGFIKWLVKNDKINIYKLEFQVNFMFPLWKNFEQSGSENIEEYSKYESLIMILSISDTPIEDLINYLK